jgi:hypothetical protein
VEAVKVLKSKLKLFDMVTVNQVPLRTWLNPGTGVQIQTKWSDYVDQPSQSTYRRARSVHNAGRGNCPPPRGQFDTLVLLYA